MQKPNYLTVLYCMPDFNTNVNNTKPIIELYKFYENFMVYVGDGNSRRRTYNANLRYRRADLTNPVN